MKRLLIFILFAAVAVGASSVKVGVGSGKTKTGAGSGKTKIEATPTPPPPAGFALVNHLEYSPNGGGLTTGAVDCTASTLIVVFIGTYKDWYPTAVVDSNSNNYTACTQYPGSSQAGQFWYFRNPTGSLGALTFTVTGVSGNINLYSYFGVMAFSGGATSTLDQQSGALDSTDPLQPGSITPSQPNALVVMGIFNYAAGASPTTTGGTYYGVAKSGTIGMGGTAWVVQSSATAINNTWVSSGAAGGENAVVIASFIP